METVCHICGEEIDGDLQQEIVDRPESCCHDICQQCRDDLILVDPVTKMPHYPCPFCEQEEEEGHKVKSAGREGEQSPFHEKTSISQDPLNQDLLSSDVELMIRNQKHDQYALPANNTSGLDQKDSIQRETPSDQSISNCKTSHATNKQGGDRERQCGEMCIFCTGLDMDHPSQLCVPLPLDSEIGIASFHTCPQYRLLNVNVKEHICTSTEKNTCLLCLQCN